MMTVFLISNCLPAYADGIGDEQRTNYPGVVDYRYHIVNNNPDHQKPAAGFALQIKDSTGNLQPGTIDSGSNNTSSNAIVSEQDSPVINAAIGENIIINNLSTKGTGNSINKYDIQYRFTPEGNNRENYEIHPQMVNSFNAVKNIIENLPLNQAGTYEIFMAVADNAPCLPGAINWSANGNLRINNTANPNFPNGMFWYFTEALVIVGGASPDFFPTPEGSNQWQESYKDPNIGAKSYEAEPGAFLNIPVTLHNAGTQAITDFKAVWYGHGNDAVGGWANPIWTAGEVDIPAGGFQEFTVPVTTPQAGEENRMVFKANVEGLTAETNQENNIMIIRIGNPGVDLKVTTEPTRILYLTQYARYVHPGVTIRVKRIDTGANPVQATFTYKVPGHNSVTQTITVPPNSNYWEHHSYNVTHPGSFTTTASAYPIGLTDINPLDNDAHCIQQVQENRTPQNIDTSPKIRVGLTG